MHRRFSLMAVVAAFMLAASGLFGQAVTGGSAERAWQALDPLVASNIRLRPPISNPTTNRNYTAVPESGVVVRDASTGTIVTTIPVAPRVVQLVVNPQTNLIYAISSNGVLTVIDALTDAVPSTLVAGPSGT